MCSLDASTFLSCILAASLVSSSADKKLVRQCQADPTDANWRSRAGDAQRCCRQKVSRAMFSGGAGKKSVRPCQGDPTDANWKSKAGDAQRSDHNLEVQKNLTNFLSRPGCFSARRKV